MTYDLFDLSKLSINDDFLKQENKFGIIIKTSYFKNDLELRDKLRQLKSLNRLICLDVDCSRNKILGAEPNLEIFKACNLYKTRAKDAIEITFAKAFRVAHIFLNEGIDLYTSEIFSFSDNIFNSNNANECFNQYHTAIMSAWINGLNSAGMLACVKVNQINSPLAQRSFYRLRVQISAALCDDDNFNLLQRNLHFNGYHLNQTKAKNKNPGQDNLKQILGGKITQESCESIDV